MSTNRRGIPGVWFYSLDCNQPLAVWAARRFFGLPYFHARMSSRRSDWVDYASARQGTPAVARYRYRGRGPAQESAVESLAFFLLERYFLYAFRRPQCPLLRGQVIHSPYHYQEAEVEEASRVPAHLDGFEDVSGPPVHTCYVHRVDVRIFGTYPVTASG